MAGTTQNHIGSTTKEAAADLSAAQFKFVKLDSNGRVALAGSGEMIFGVLQNKPDALGKAADVVTHGESKIHLSGTLATAALVMSDANGEAVAATGTTARIAGQLTKGGAADEYGSIDLIRGGFAAQT